MKLRRTEMALFWGHIRRKAPDKVVPLRVFGSTCTISRFGESFRDGQYS